MQKNAVSSFFAKLRSYIAKIDKLIFGNVDNALTKIITPIYNLGDKNAKSKQQDVVVIKKQAYYIIAIPITLWVTYNWFFITFYKESGMKINTQMNFDSLESFLPMLRFFFYYLYFPTLLFGKVINDIPPIVDSTKKYEPMNVLFNDMLLFLIMVLVISYIICKYSIRIKDIFFGFIGGSVKVSPFLTNIFYVIILFTMLMSFFPTSVEGIAVNYFNLITAPFSTIFGGLFKLIFTFINIATAGIFFIGFIIIHSLFSIFIYSKSSLTLTIKMINEYLHDSIQGIGKYDCPPNTLDGWVGILKIGLEIMYACLYEFIYILFFFIGLIVYLIKIKSTPNKIIFSIVNILVIAGISVYAYTSKITNLFEEMEKAKYESE
jgi:hypothetical protein